MKNHPQKPQWIIARDGLLGAGYYWIERDRLLATWGDGLLQWPRHVIGKQWIDFENFEATFRAALERFEPDHDRDMVDRSFKKARALKRHYEFTREVEAELFPDGKPFLQTSAQFLESFHEVQRRYAVMREARQ